MFPISVELPEERDDLRFPAVCRSLTNLIIIVQYRSK
jgi:hypothetical protein